MMEWTTDLPKREGRYFIRPAGTSHQGKVVVVSEFGGDLVAWASPEIAEAFRMASLDRLHLFLGHVLEWAYIDGETDPEWRFIAPAYECESTTGDHRASEIMTRRTT